MYKLLSQEDMNQMTTEKLKNNVLKEAVDIILHHRDGLLYLSKRFLEIQHVSGIRFPYWRVFVKNFKFSQVTFNQTVTLQ